MTSAEDHPVAVTPVAACGLAAATAALGCVNTVLASFLLEDPFQAGVDDLRAELTSIRKAGIGAMTTVQVACPSIRKLDLDPVADAC